MYIVICIYMHYDYYVIVYILCKSTTYLHFRIVYTLHHQIIYENTALILQTGNLCVGGNDKYYDFIKSSALDLGYLALVIICYHRCYQKIPNFIYVRYHYNNMFNKHRITVNLLLNYFIIISY